jgi:hypothetical protein
MEDNMWKDQFEKMLSLLGHRNWILVVDKAYPLQTAPGITTINTGAPLPEVLHTVLKGIQASTHVNPIIYTDKELQSLDESFCPGIDKLRSGIYETIDKLFGQKNYQSILHDDVFEKLDTASKLFNVLVLKTEATLPYSSVFIQLDCGYWNGEQEKTLREKMK